MDSRTPGAIFVIVTLLACSGDSSTSEAAGPSGAIDLGQLQLVDLSYVYNESTLYWPTATERFTLEELAYGPSEGGYFYAAYSFATPEHGGTHLDAPIHFGEGGWTVDQVPLERLLLPAVVIDASEEAAGDRDYRLTVEKVAAWEAEHGRVPAGAAVLLRTGWGRNWPDALSYLGDDTPGDASNLHFPAFGEQAALLLIEERQVALLGIDTASLDYGPSTDFVVHQIAAAANVPGLENVANLERLPARGAWIIALPVKIGGGSGGPVRIVGLLPGE